MARKQLQDPPKRFRRETETSPARQPFGRKPGPKKPVNVSVDAELLKVAKEMGINVSNATEDALRRLTEPERIRRFQEENKAFFESYNAYIERNGVFGEELLDFEDDPPV
ncbi:MAG: type II toxin-antitoxin system CcdA family antitoxin [Rhizomicrobium sp.]